MAPDSLPRRSGKVRMGGSMKAILRLLVERGELNTTQIGAELDKHPPHVHTALKALEAAGLVTATKKRVQGQRRQFVYALTPEGEKFPPEWPNSEWAPEDVVRAMQERPWRVHPEDPAVTDLQGRVGSAYARMADA